MRLYKRGSIYWFELIYEGQRIQKSTRVKNRRDADDIAAAFRTALAKGDVGITERKTAPTFSVAMKAFLDWSKTEHKAHPRTATRYKTSSAALKRFFRETPLDRISADDVERFKTSRASEKGSRTGRKLRPATVNRELACLKALFNHAIKAELVLRNPVSKVKFLAEQNAQNRVVSFAEMKAYLALATPTLQDVATLIFETGMRPEEVYTIRRAHVDLASGWLQVPHGKTAAARRRIKLTAPALRVLSARLQDDGGSIHVFPCETDADRPIPKVNNAHDRALRDSRVAPFRLYDLRHTWATRAAEAGIDPVTLAAMLGHSRIQMVMRYAHPTQAHQSSAMDKLEQYDKVRRRRESRVPTAERAKTLRSTAT
jgi:integrase